MKLIAYYSSEHGGMLGGYSLTEIAYTSDGRCKVHTAGRTFHSEPITHKRYYADGLLEKLTVVCERYNVISWTDLPKSNIFMHDAPSGSDKFTFEDGTKIILGSDMQYPAHASDMFGELKQLISESLNYSVDLEVTEEAPGFAMGMMGMMTNMPQNPVKVQKAPDQADGTTKWASFCVDCGAKFMGSQRFCAECGSVRKKL